jgi:hypothetical protein
MIMEIEELLLWMKVIDLDFETCEDSGVIELDGFKIKYVTFVS